MAIKIRGYPMPVLWFWKAFRFLSFESNVFFFKFREKVKKITPRLPFLAWFGIKGETELLKVFFKCSGAHFQSFTVRILWFLLFDLRKKFAKKKNPRLSFPPIRIFGEKNLSGLCFKCFKAPFRKNTPSESRRTNRAFHDINFKLWRSYIFDLKKKWI